LHKTILMSNKKEILIFGYGNPGRQDDGIAIEMVKQLKSVLGKGKNSNFHYYLDTQLHMEDAYRISEMDIVFFIDASTEDINSVKISRVIPSEPKSSVSLHAFSPGFVLKLCQKIYKKSPDLFLVHVKGYEWDIKEELSLKARENMTKAINRIYKLLQNPEDIINILN